jgi:hypothetical protein
MELLCTLQAICHLHMWLGLEEMDAGIELCACSFIPVTFFPTTKTREKLKKTGVKTRLKNREKLLDFLKRE